MSNEFSNDVKDLTKIYILNYCTNGVKTYRYYCVRYHVNLHTFTQIIFSLLYQLYQWINKKLNAYTFFFKLSNPLKQSLRGIYLMNKTILKSFPENKFVMFHKIALQFKQKYCALSLALLYIHYYHTCMTTATSGEQSFLWQRFF